MQSIDQELLHKIENAIGDLMLADSKTFDRYIKKLLRLLREPALEAIVFTLKKDLDLNAWLRNNEHSNGMGGTGSIVWPETTEEELGIIILLTERFAEESSFAMGFSYEYCYAGNNNVSSNFNNMVRIIYSTFARELVEYIQEKTAVIQPEKRLTGLASARKVFIVHGHDGQAKEAVARFLEKLNFEVIILNERANRALTLIEKIEAHSDVGFVVVLLTPDDFGAAKGEEARSRARQNVILELGYFAGKLDRHQICVLKRGEVEVPSDLLGVMLEAFDENGGWKMILGRELKGAGFEVDLNLVL